MNVSGRVHNGVVVLEGTVSLPEGASVRVSFDESLVNRSATSRHRIELPLVRCDQPGSIHLTNQEISDILDDEDASPRH